MLFWVSGAPTRMQTLKKLFDVLSEICISESTPPTVTKRASIASITKILWNSGNSGGSPAAPAGGARRKLGSSGRGSLAAVRVYKSLSPPCRGSIWTSESQGPSYFPPVISNHGRNNHHYESLLVVEVPETSDEVLMIHNIISRDVMPCAK